MNFKDLLGRKFLNDTVSIVKIFEDADKVGIKCKCGKKYKLSPNNLFKLNYHPCRCTYSVAYTNEKDSSVQINLNGVDVTDETSNLNNSTEDKIFNKNEVDGDDVLGESIDFSTSTSDSNSDPYSSKKKQKPIPSKSLIPRNLKKDTDSNLLEREDRIRERLGDIKSTFLDEVASIQHIIETQKNSGATELQVALLLTYVELIPIVEAKFRAYGSERTAYALNAMVTQTMALISAIKAENDSSKVGLLISQKILQPIFLNLTHSIIQELSLVRSLTSPILLDNKESEFVTTLNGCVHNLVRLLEEQYKAAQDQILVLLDNDER